MGYHGDSLESFFSPELAAVTARKLADTGAASMTERARNHTPVEFGTTRASWEAKRAERTQVEGLPAYEGRAENDHYVAKFLEHGTVAHEEVPDDAEALETPEGPRRLVRHPGMEPRHILSRAATELEAAFPAEAQPVLEEFKRAQEADTRSKRGRR
jgi:hypothetical protein